ncbi:hypothetical protein HH214_01065 [Mucilaginibacter robiniae]|uniref:Uncharacterized protein n=1 Tax=Mucilaginibacter robiniae TaxID=2728022 RepID=A0A7L5DU32_9SPHI|nr:hypothetical protein [Mucilaginibacter robiniae]QJD94562.1 hypothetical protein HH214_01065 [Mucilaginibacter robiniae]
MRINPSEKVLRGNVVNPVTQARIDRITRIVAIVVAFLSTFGLFVKILFL